MNPIKISVQIEDFDMTRLHQWLVPADASVGAIVTFTGLVRDQTTGDFEGLFLEHYPGMTEQALLSIAEQACDRWAVNRLAIVHRVGRLLLADNIVYVGVSSPHRAEAFEAAQFVMDYLKRDAPFWKKELGADAKWVEQKQSDLDQAAGWEKN